jgi:hypothetical protein
VPYFAEQIKVADPEIKRTSVPVKDQLEMPEMKEARQWPKRRNECKPLKYDLPSVFSIAARDQLGPWAEFVVSS